jgi:hypothetical protein
MPATLAKSQTAAKLYDRDFYEWTAAQASALRENRPGGIDWANLAEEIESLGKSDKRRIASNLNVLVLHLLKWCYQPSKRKADWKGSIVEHRTRIRTLIADSPSLGTYPGGILDEEYASARLKAIGQTGLPESCVPETCPFAIEDILDPGFWPGE